MKLALVVIGGMMLGVLMGIAHWQGVLPVWWIGG